MGFLKPEMKLFSVCTCTQKQAPLNSLYELNPILAFDRINSLIKILLILE